MGLPTNIRDRKKEHRAWVGLFTFAVLACVGVYVANLVIWEVDPGNVWGLSYGIAATTLMVGAWLLAVRRRTMHLSSKLRLGRSRTWLYFHIYGGTVAMLLILMHTEFRLPTGLITTWLYWLSVVTVVSGFVGLFLQKWVPRMLSSGLSNEVHYDRIPELIEHIRERAEALVADSHESIRTLYEGKIAHSLTGPKRRLIYFVDVSGGIQSLNEFVYLRRRLSGEQRDKLAELEQLYRAKLECDAHYTLQLVLRIWLLSHVPISLALLGFLVLHLFAVYYW